MCLSTGSEQTVAEGRALETLELLCLLTDRFSHALRTPLGVALGIVDDSAAGVRLTIQDYEDARSALRGMVSVLDAAKDLANPAHYRPIESSLTDFISEYAADLMSFNSAGPGKISLELRQSSAGRRLMDHRLLYRALRLSLSFLFSRKERFCPNSTRPVTVIFDSADGAESILCSGPGGPALSGSRSGPLRQLVSEDHTVAALGLIFAEAVFKLHGAGCAFLAAGDGGLSLTASFMSADKIKPFDARRRK